MRQILEGQRAVLLTLGATLLVSLATSLALSTVVAIRFLREQQGRGPGRECARWRGVSPVETGFVSQTGGPGSQWAG